MSKTLSIEFTLGSGERLLWSGMPRQGLMLRRADAMLIPFSLLWAQAAVRWEWSSVTQHSPQSFEFMGIPLLFVAAYLTIGRFFYDAWQRAGTAYGLTTERVLIATRGFGSSLTSFDLASLPAMSLTEQANGLGSIAFGQPTGRPGRLSFNATLVPTFQSIPDAKGVYDQIRSARDAVHGAATA